MTGALIGHLKKENHAAVMNVSSVLGFVPLALAAVCDGRIYLFPPTGFSERPRNADWAGVLVFPPKSGAEPTRVRSGSRLPSAKELTMARFQGKHVAGIAAKLKAN